MSRIHVRVLTLALCAIAWLAFVPASASAQQPSFRAEKWQFFVPLNFTFSKDLEGENGSMAEINNDLSWGFGFGYNFSNRFMLGFQTTWLGASYDATIPVDDDGDGTPDGPETFGGSVGLRKELGRSFFLEGSYNLLWIAFSESTPSFSAIELNIGWLF